MKLPIQENGLENREALLQAFCQLMEPLEKHFGDKNTQLFHGHTGSKTCSRTAAMEGLLRPLWGLIPATLGGLHTSVWLKYQDAIRYGTDPQSEHYWGDVGDFDQKMVEMAAIGLALVLTPERLWDPLSPMEQERFAIWMNQVNAHDLPVNNWRFFVVLINLGLKKVGAPYNQKRLQDSLEMIESYYLSDGWYADGKTEQRDYYISFAMHFYGLIYSKLMEIEDRERSQRFKERGVAFAKDFIYWFGAQGDALPYGRSLTYRFAQCAFWGALAFADVEVFSWGVMKGIVLRHLRYWFKQDIFDHEGILSIGYSYENLVMADGYNAPGSPYWAMKALLPLALLDSHPFWQAEEAPLPELEKQVFQNHPHMIICREDNEHFAAFTSGQYAGFEPINMAAKYEKFVYSNLFGFSVPRGDYGLEQGAYDNMLALSEQDDHYRVRRNCEMLKMDEHHLVSTWSPWSDVKVTTWLIAGLPWHIRIHYIDTKRPLDLAEGGFAIARENKMGTSFSQISQNDKYGIILHGNEEDEIGCSGIFDLLETAEAVAIKAHGNTNLCCPRTFIPTLCKRISPGQHWMVSAVYGSKQVKLPLIPPSIHYAKDEDRFEILFEGKEINIFKQTQRVKLSID